MDEWNEAYGTIFPIELQMLKKFWISNFGEFSSFGEFDNLGG